MQDNSGALAYVVSEQDNVATALAALPAGTVRTIGHAGGSILANEPIPMGYKIALGQIKTGQPVIKYGVRIAKATRDIRAGDCVHAHNAVSLNDTRSSGFDAESAAPADMRYELDDEGEH